MFCRLRNLTPFPYHDALGRRTQSTLPNGDHIQYAWDKGGQHQSIHFNGQTVVDFTRDALGREIGRQHGNQLHTQTAYDPQGRLQEQRLSNANATLNQRQYHYNQAGQLSQIDDQGRGSTQYFYDAIDRLVAVNGPQPETFVHDPAGNLLSANDRYEQPSAEQNSSEQDHSRQVQNNRLNFFGDQHYFYDEQGNRTQTQRGKGQKLVTQYRYDALNQLTEVEHNGVITQYEYDPLGRRIAKRSAHKTTTFLWNDDVLLSETNQTHIEGQEKRTEQKTYLFEPDSFTPVAFVQNDEIFHYHTDHLGTPQDITNAKGNIVWSANYRAYGNLALANVEEVENNLRFQGQYFDEESGLHYNRFRYYDPSCGRFINQDPIGLLGGTNSYQYVPNPIAWVDPLGLSCKEQTPSEFAQSWQSSGDYPGIDNYRDITLKEGKVIYGGAPGQGNYYTTESALRRADYDAEKYFNGVQVRPHPEFGYRPGVTAYRVKEDVSAAFGITKANPQHGSGGLPQIVIENYEDVLEPLYSIPLK